MFPITNTKNVVVDNTISTRVKGHNYAKLLPNHELEAQCKGVLRRHDANGDGRLNKKELKLAFKNAGSSMPGWRAFRAFRCADKNGDGFIDEAELLEVLKYAVERGYQL